MKVGLSTYSLSKALRSGEMNVGEAIRWIADNGGEHVEIMPSGFNLGDNPGLVDEIKRAAEDTGIELSSYTVPANFIQDTPAAVSREIERIKAEVDTAATLGVGLMRHDAGKRPREQTSLTQFEKDLPVLVDACGRIADHAAQYSITTSVENHGFHLQSSERIRRLVELVDRPNFRTTLDIGNFLCVDQDPVAAVRENAPITSMVHVKDFYYRRASADPGEGWFQSRGGNFLRGAIVGHGDVDVAGALGVLKETGYDGYLSVEFEGMEDCLTGSRLGILNTKRLLSP